MGRPRRESSVVGDPGAKFFWETRGTAQKQETRNKKETEATDVSQTAIHPTKAGFLSTEPSPPQTVRSRVQWPVLTRPQMAGFEVTTEALRPQTRFESLNMVQSRLAFVVLHENLEKRVIYAGFSSLSDLTAAVAVAVGMWKPASFAGFQAPRAGRTVVADVPSFRPRSAISTARPRFIGHSGENLLFGRSGGAEIAAFEKAA